MRGEYAPKAKVFEQRERRGTAHAVLSAREALAGNPDDVLVMFVDTPLVGRTHFRVCAGTRRRRSRRGAGLQARKSPRAMGGSSCRAASSSRIREEREATAKSAKSAYATAA